MHSKNEAPYMIEKVMQVASCDKAKKAFHNGKSDIDPEQLEPIIYFFAVGNKG